ncbi:MAG: hypothetical protein RLZZ21_1552, partial [Planctomycetota bacterium]
HGGLVGTGTPSWDNRVWRKDP